MSTRPRRRRERGQSLAELAFVVPIVLLLLMSIVQIGFLLYTQVGLTNAVREGARNAAAIAVSTTTQASAAAIEYYTRLTDATTGFLRRNVGGYNAGSLIPSTSPPTPTTTMVCYYSITDASGAPAVMARVEVEYRHPLFVPLLSDIIDGFDGANDGGYRLGASEDIRVANAVLATGATNIGTVGSPTCNT